MIAIRVVRERWWWSWRRHLRRLRTVEIVVARESARLKLTRLKLTCLKLTGLKLTSGAIVGIKRLCVIVALTLVLAAESMLSTTMMMLMLLMAMMTTMMTMMTTMMMLKTVWLQWRHRRNAHRRHHCTLIEHRIAFDDVVVLLLAAHQAHAQNDANDDAHKRRGTSNAAVQHPVDLLRRAAARGGGDAHCGTAGLRVGACCNLGHSALLAASELRARNELARGAVVAITHVQALAAARASHRRQQMARRAVGGGARRRAVGAPLGDARVATLGTAFGRLSVQLKRLRVRIAEQATDLVGRLGALARVEAAHVDAMVAAAHRIVVADTAAQLHRLGARRRRRTLVLCARLGAHVAAEVGREVALFGLAEAVVGALDTGARIAKGGALERRVAARLALVLVDETLRLRAADNIHAANAKVTHLTTRTGVAEHKRTDRLVGERGLEQKAADLPVVATHAEIDETDLGIGHGIGHFGAIAGIDTRDIHALSKRESLKTRFRGRHRLKVSNTYIEFFLTCDSIGAIHRLIFRRTAHGTQRTGETGAPLATARIVNATHNAR